ncbi:Zinc-transporting ATPase [Microcystis aeruginosa PCC 9432]|uniref:Zinc-transporting ATPase n=1 Tax=Microcystis aeruginosa PCC 9432 TaxID=1160280 RepID=A0A822L8U0_MICAE|nr:heavy metal translocating P-type ATPase [Microcystis aeruginosa]TRT92224.1 MAG: heavy metal translocating P-type ATPase [Microcystis aeruginosa Ma_OC_LR_19540900_S633]CCH92639.1 Zinc-transporting ATPase [Microcystis aeruginosa PCC 9432]
MIQSISSSWLSEYSSAFAAGICAILVFFGWLCLHFNLIGLALILLAIAYVVGGYESTQAGLTTLFEEKELDVDLLMIVAALGAAILGLWDSNYYLIIDGAVLILIFAISGALEQIAMAKTDRNIRSLMAMTPDTARLITGDREKEVPVKQLHIGDIVLVKPGELIPIDGIIMEGNSPINQAPITGESLPVDKTIGEEVFAGTLNGAGVLRLKVETPPESRLIERVIRLVEKAQNESPPSQEFIEGFERGYAKIIVILGLIFGILPPFLWGWTWETTIYRALIFLVVASPCALMASIMPALLSGIANGAKQGILFKNGARLEMIGRIRAIAFDKTGTLTLGKLQVVEIIPIHGISENEVLAVAASLESCSEHPIGAAITATARERGINFFSANQVQAVSGRGITGKIADKSVSVGNFAYIRDHIADLDQNILATHECLQKEGKTLVWVVQENQMLGAIAVADTLRESAVNLVKQLKKIGIEHIVLITGDNQQSADKVAKKLGIEEVYADLLPEDKLTVIKNLQEKYHTVAMVGDGINDAPALAMANVGIAMGKAGSDVALETADIILMSDNLAKIPSAINLGRRANRIVKQNITFALAFIGILLIANFVGDITLPLGVIGHEGSTVLVTLSGLRLFK